MRNLKDAKDIYDHIVIPEELDDRLKKALESAPEPQKPSPQLFKFTRWTATAAAALFLCFTIGLNSSESFAMEMAKLPVIGTIAKVLTVRSYELTEGNTTTIVEIPEIQAENSTEAVTNTISDVNAKINELVEDFTDQKYTEIEEHKEVFLSNGGTVEEWNQRSIDINVNYEVKHQSDTTLSLLVDAWISWFHFQEERHFYNIDLVTGNELTLPDLLGPDAYDYAEKCVLAQMHTLIESDPDTYTFWGINEEEDMGNEFIGVDETTPFYINKEGTVVISYNKYDVAPGFMGIVEFEIPSR